VFSWRIILAAADLWARQRKLQPDWRTKEFHVGVSVVERAAVRTRGASAAGQPTPTGYTMEPMPRTLLEAIVLQLTSALAENKRYKQCAAPGCQVMLEIRPGVNRRDRDCCSDACRQLNARRKETQNAVM
jgi:hypothetical protein